MRICFISPSCIHDAHQILCDQPIKKVKDRPEHLVGGLDEHYYCKDERRLPDTNELICWDKSSQAGEW